MAQYHARNDNERHNRVDDYGDEEIHQEVPPAPVPQVPNNNINDPYNQERIERIRARMALNQVPGELRA